MPAKPLASSHRICDSLFASFCRLIRLFAARCFKSCVHPCTKFNLLVLSFRFTACFASTFVSFRFVAGFLRPCPKNKIQNKTKRKRNRKKSAHKKLLPACFIFILAFSNFPCRAASVYIGRPPLYAVYIYIYIYGICIYVLIVLFCVPIIFVSSVFVFCLRLLCFFAALHVACLPPSMHFSPARKIIYVYSRLAI